MKPLLFFLICMLDGIIIGLIGGTFRLWTPMCSAIISIVINLLVYIIMFS